MKILAIDTSCDETSVAVTDKLTVLSNVLWSQASMHAQFGGVYPSLAKRAHEERIDWVLTQALKKSKIKIEDLDAIAATQGPGLAIALEVGIQKAKELAIKYNKQLIPVNHVEGHLLSVFARPKIFNGQFSVIQKQPQFPAMALVASGKHTDLIYIEKVGKYKVVASTIDDALGEALDKGARMLGLGYPGGPILEKLAKGINPNSYKLPIPLAGQKERFDFSYSGLKTAMYRVVESQKPLTKERIQNLAASFQNTAFKHVENLTKIALSKYKVKQLWFGGGVSANIELRSRLRQISKDHFIPLLIPYAKRLCTDNAAMIGVAAFLNNPKKLKNKKEIENLERVPRLKLN